MAGQSGRPFVFARMKITWHFSFGTFLVGLLFVTGCSSPATHTLQRFEFTQPEMGSLFSITLYAPDQATADHAAKAAFDRVAELNRVMSDYDPQSELMQLCRKPSGVPVRVSDDLFD